MQWYSGEGACFFVWLSLVPSPVSRRWALKPFQERFLAQRQESALNTVECGHKTGKKIADSYLGHNLFPLEEQEASLCV